LGLQIGFGNWLIAVVPGVDRDPSLPLVVARIFRPASSNPDAPVPRVRRG
jgi:hypothetical protein